MRANKRLIGLALCLLVFSLPIPPATLVGVMVGMGIAQLVPVPGAVGSLEATEVGIVALAGGSASLGLAVGLVVRIRETIWILLGLATLYAEGLWGALRGPPKTAPKTVAIESNE